MPVFPEERRDLTCVNFRRTAKIVRDLENHNPAAQFSWVANCYSGPD